MHLGTLTELMPDYAGCPVEQVTRHGGHRYIINGGEPQASVTTVLGVINKPALLAWTRNSAIEAAVTEPPYAAYNPGETLADSRKKQVAKVKQTLKDRNDAVIQFGTEVHHAIDEALRSDFVQDGGDPITWVDQHIRYGNPTGADSAIDALQWLMDMGAVKVWPEVTLWHPEGKLPPGQADIVFEDGNGDLVVADWKCSSGVYEGHCHQVAAYAMNLMRLTVRCPQAYVVKLPRPGDETFKAVRVNAIGPAANVVYAAKSLFDAQGQATLELVT